MPELATEIRQLLDEGRDLHGREVDAIRKQQARAIEFARLLRWVCESVADGAVEFGQVASLSKQLRRLEVASVVFDQCAEHDGKLLAALEEQPVTRRLSRRGRGGAARRISSESRSIAEPQFSSRPAPLQTVLVELGPQEYAETVDLVRAQAEELSERELASFIRRAAWVVDPEAWGMTPPRERAEWLLRNLVRWRELVRKRAEESS